MLLLLAHVEDLRSGFIGTALTVGVQSKRIVRLADAQSVLRSISLCLSIMIPIGFDSLER